MGFVDKAAVEVTWVFRDGIGDADHFGGGVRDSHSLAGSEKNSWTGLTSMKVAENESVSDCCRRAALRGGLQAVSCGNKHNILSQSIFGL